MKLTFLGGAQTVTGSKYLVEAGPARVLVDCGLFQGLKDLRRRNWAPLPIDPASIDAVVLTHAHLDPCGYLPRLVAAGFRGRIFCTVATRDLCGLVLPDAGRLQEEDARQSNRHGYTRHHPALPLFTEEEAFHAMLQLQPVGFDRSIPVASGVEVEFIHAGHLLGSAYVRMRVGDSQILFGGDLGRYDRPVLPDPTSVEEADVLLLESTYGDRTHASDDDGEALAKIINDTHARRGKVIIPSFAIGRVEELLYWLKKLEEDERIPVLPVYVDSPMAIQALRFYTAHSRELDPELRPAGRDVCSFCTERFQTVDSPEKSKELTRSQAPSIIVSASGMATGGRVLHHLKAMLPDARHSVVFVGYQAAGTRGRRLVDGIGQVKIHGEHVRVAASVRRLDSMSAHADSGEVLRWLSHFTRPPQTTYLVHGEPGPMAVQREAIATRLGWSVHIPSQGETVALP